MLGLRLAGLAAMLLQSIAFSAQDSSLTLDTPVWTNNQVQFTLHCASNGAYVIEHSSDLLSWAPLLTNSSFGATRLIIADAPDDLNFYRAAFPASPIFAGAVATVSNVNFLGNNITIDSFDSGDPNFSDNGLYPADINKTKAGGDVCTRSGIASIGNANIKGHVRTGPGTNTISLGPNGTVGDRAWVEGASTGIKPGWSSTDFNGVFPDVVEPTTAWTTFAKNNLTIGGTNYDYAFLSSGDYSIASYSGSLYVGTNVSVQLRILNSVGMGASTNIIRIAPENASLHVFMEGASWSISGSAAIDNQSGRADRFQLLGLPSCTSISFGSSAVFTGCIYAPEASFSITGGGSSSMVFIGASVTKSISLIGHFNLHYDENLRRIGPFH